MLVRARTQTNPPKERAISPSSVTACLIFVGGVLTLVGGFINLYKQTAKFGLTFDWCDQFVKAQCNQGWENVFTFDIVKLAKLWQPLIVGVFVVSMSFPNIRKESWIPSTWLQAFWLCLFEAFFGNFGYWGFLAFLTGIFNLICAVMCLVIALFVRRDFLPMSIVCVRVA